MKCRDNKIYNKKDSKTLVYLVASKKININFAHNHTTLLNKTLALVFIKYHYLFVVKAKFK